MTKPKYSTLCAALAKSTMQYAEKMSVPVTRISVMLVQEGGEEEGAAIEPVDGDPGKRNEDWVYDELLKVSLASLKDSLRTKRPDVTWRHLGVCIEASGGHRITGSTENRVN